MKKFLALVLALVMTMSLVTISAGAEDFTDDSKITYEEAVDVMSAAGVVGGYADGSFNPQGTLTRGAAAKIICNMILGPTTAAALAADAAPFSDVPADHVFAGYIAYCVKEGIISGYADGTFRPAGTLTGYAFWKMLLGALGYDADIEGYTGSNWSISVAKRGLNIKLNKGLEGTFVGTKALTREEACLYAFNTLKARVVEYDSKSTISVGDIVINQTSDAKVDYDYADFADKYFNDLTDVSSVDSCGRPATTWYTSKKLTKASKVGTYSKTADYVIVLEKALKAKTDAELIAELQELADNEDLFYNSETELYIDGVASKTADMVAANEPGTVIELFCEDVANGNYITDVAVLDYEIDYIDKLDTKLTKAQKEDGATVEIELKGGVDVLDINFAGYDAETYVKGAYVLYVQNPVTKKIIASEIAEVVEGEVVQVKSGKISIDGTWYDEVITDAIKHGTEGSFYLNKAGQVCAIDATEEVSDNYAYIYALDKDTTGLNADGYAAGSVKAYFVKADGTKGSAVVDATYDAQTKKFTYDYDKTEVTEGLIAYTMDGDVLCKADPADELNTTGVKAAVNKTNVALDSQYATVDTQFIFMNSDGKTMKVSTATGYKSVDSAASATKYYVYDKDTDAVLFAFVDGKNANVETELYAVILDKTPVEDVDADDVAVNIYSVAIDGEETTLTVKQSADVLANKNAGAVVTYEVTDGYVSAAKYVETADVTAVYDDYLVTDDGILYYNDEVIWTITKEYDVKGVLETVTVDEDGSYDKEWNIFYTVEDTNKLTNVWIVENIK